MVDFSVDSQRRDPYRDYKFRVKLDDRCVAGFSKMSVLKVSAAVAESAERDALPSPLTSGRTKFQAISLERGITHDRDFEAWAKKVWNVGPGPVTEVSLKDVRKHVVIDLYDEAGRLAVSYKIISAWASDFQATPDMDANANTLAIQKLKLENEGWERLGGVDERREGADSNAP